MAGTGRALIPNASAVYRLDDVRGYEVMTLRRLRDTYPLWCVEQPVWFNRVDDPTRPFLSFLSVRWLLAESGFEPPAGWPRRAEGAGLRLFENPRALPRAFAPRATRSEPDASRRLELLAGIGDFDERGVVESGPASDWAPNGPARVEMREARGDRMEMEVRAESPAFVATSIPAWPGWRAAVDGTAAATIPYNHAFLAVRVPAGTHRVSMRYRPAGFLYGAAVSAVSLGASLAVLLRRRRSGSRLASPPARMSADSAD
jgi:hypothetical protein